MHFITEILVGMWGLTFFWGMPYACYLSMKADDLLGACVLAVTWVMALAGFYLLGGMEGSAVREGLTIACVVVSSVVCMVMVKRRARLEALGSLGCEP